MKRAGEVVGEVLLDDEDYATVSHHSWVLSRPDRGYAQRSLRVPGGRRTVLMHRLLMGLEQGDPRQVDHINGNTLDNRRCNLRIATTEQQALNKRSRRGSTSRFKGVRWHRRTCRWQAEVKRRGRYHYLGSFLTEEAAAQAIAEFDRTLGIEISVFDLMTGPAALPAPAPTTTATGTVTAP